MISRARRGSGSLWLPLAMSALLSLPYLVAVRSFFVSDDWVYLTYYGAIPPWQVWRYFSPRVIWFYRPLQALQFGWLYHAAGREHTFRRPAGLAVRTLTAELSRGAGELSTGPDACRGGGASAGQPG